MEAASLTSTSSAAKTSVIWLAGQVDFTFPSVACISGSKAFKSDMVTGPSSVSSCNERNKSHGKI